LIEPGGIVQLRYRGRRVGIRITRGRHGGRSLKI
jgi:hypothetical protein